MRASVLIVEYATRAFLPRCLEALEASTLPRDAFEIIVVDNASPTPVAEWSARFSRVRFLTSRRNLGFAGGNALGLQVARGTHVALLNPDAVPTPGWLGRVLAPLDDPGIGIVGSKIFHPGTDVLQHAGGVLFGNARSEHLGRGQRDAGQFESLRDVDYVCGAAIAVRRDVIERVGFLSASYFPAYYEETELCVRARRAGFRVVVAPDAIVEHHEGVASGGARADAFLSRYHDSRIRFVLRNYSAHEILTRFLPAELAWLGRHCPARERGICLSSYREAFRTAWDESRGQPRSDDVVFDSWRGEAP